MSTDSLRSVHAADNKLVSELINNKYYKCVTITNGKGTSAVSVILPARCYALARSVYCWSVTVPYCVETSWLFQASPENTLFANY